MPGGHREDRELPLRWCNHWQRDRELPLPVA